MAAVARVWKCSQPLWPGLQQVRTMATLKDISMRLKAVKKIQKITKSMKMVAASKYSRAERELRPARVFGSGTTEMFTKAELVAEEPERKQKHLMICMTSDKGLCGGIHSGVAKATKAALQKRPSQEETVLVCVGDRLRSILQRTHSNFIMMSFNEIGKLPPVFSEASLVAQAILDSGYEFNSAEIIFNRFRSVISFRTTHLPFVPLATLIESENMSIFDDVDEEILCCYHEISLANLIFYALKEGACSEQSARMTAMDSASTNASEIIEKLTLTFNRTRQAVITKELIEIISGAAAV